MLLLKLKTPLKKGGERGKKQIMIKYLFYCNIICLTCQYLKRINIGYSKQSSRKIEIVHRFFARYFNNHALIYQI